jgi:hypothetical protein
MQLLPLHCGYHEDELVGHNVSLMMPWLGLSTSGIQSTHSLKPPGCNPGVFPSAHLEKPVTNFAFSNATCAATPWSVAKHHDMFLQRYQEARLRILV